MIFYNLAYVPTSQRLPNNFRNRLGFSTNDTERVLGFGCLSRNCPVGYRVLGCDSHVMTSIMLLGVYGYAPHLFTSTHQNVHLLDVHNSETQNQELFNN